MLAAVRACYSKDQRGVPVNRVDRVLLGVLTVINRSSWTQFSNAWHSVNSKVIVNESEQNNEN